jgi:Asp-tRNA(Asn)/Glu-tRNA(Gln) amidotransferase B subunit
MPKYKSYLSGPDQIGRLNDEFQILKAIRGVLELNSKVMEDFKSGKKNTDSVKNFLLVQVMMVLDGKANPALVRQLIVQIMEMSAYFEAENYGDRD